MEEKNNIFMDYTVRTHDITTIVPNHFTFISYITTNWLPPFTFVILSLVLLTLLINRININS